MKPEVVLKLNTSLKLTAAIVEKRRDEWIAEYEQYISYSPKNEELGALLIDRVKRACDMCIKRFVPNPKKVPRQGWADCDPAFYELQHQEELAEDASLDGDFPLGNSYDADFMTPYFSIEQLVQIQFGETYTVHTGHYVEPAYDVLVRKGIIAELNEEWREAETYYDGGGCYSMSVTNRQYECRDKKIAEGKRCYEEAQKYMESGEWSEIPVLLMRAVEMENSDAMVDMALGYAYGTMGFPQYPGETFPMLRKAANQYGNPRACMELVEFHDNGSWGIWGNEAYELCKKAAEKGDKKAIARLEDGFDLREPKVILREQYKKGNIDALWMLYIDASDRNDTKEARMWYEKALEADQIDALLAEADKYLAKGSECYDAEYGEQCLRRAADKGNITAIKRMARLQMKSKDEAFWEKAFVKGSDAFKENKAQQTRHKRQMAWYKLAAEAGDSASMAYVSVAYRFGYPVEQNYELAYKWAEKGADAGDTTAMHNAGYLLENGFGCEKDIDKAIVMYTNSAEAGNIVSMIRLYEIYKDGLEHIPEDKTKANRYLWMSGIGHC